jgi:hypothetical protein
MSHDSFAECLYKSHDLSCLIRLLAGKKSYLLINFMSQHDTAQKCIEEFTKCCGKSLHKSGCAFLYKLRSSIKIKMFMCPKIL